MILGAFSPLRAFGQQGPRWPFRLNRNSPQARGLDLWLPVALGPNAALGKDLSGYRHDAVNFNNAAEAVGTLLGRAGANLDGLGRRLWWDADADYEHQRIQTFTRQLWFAVTPNFAGNASAQTLWQVSGRADIGFRAANSTLGANELGAVYYTGSAFRTLASGRTSFEVGRPYLVHFVREAGVGAFLYLDGALVASDTGYTGAVAYETGRDASIGAAGWSATLRHPSVVVIEARQYTRAKSAAECRADYDPATRWDLYAEETVYSVIDAPAAAGGTTYNESISLAASAALSAAAAVHMAGAVTIAGSADATAAARQDHRGAVSVAGDAGASVTARATFAGGIAVEATAAASLDGTARFTDAAALAASAALSVSAGAQAFSESIALAATPAFDAAGALHLSGSIALGASADLAAAGSLRVGESVAFAATLDASAAATLTMREAIAAAATAALAIAAESSADNVIVRTVSLSGQRHLVVTLEGRRGRTIRLRGSLSH